MIWTHSCTTTGMRTFSSFFSSDSVIWPVHLFKCSGKKMITKMFLYDKHNVLTTHPGNFTKFRVTQGRTGHNKSRTPWTYFIIFIFSLWGHFRDMSNMSKRVKKLKWWYLCQLYLDVVLFQQVINNITQEHSDRCVIILPHVNLISELSVMDTIWCSNTLRLHRTWVAHCA